VAQLAFKTLLHESWGDDAVCRRPMGGHRGGSRVVAFWSREGNRLARIRVTAVVYCCLSLMPCGDRRVMRQSVRLSGGGCCAHSVGLGVVVGMSCFGPRVETCAVLGVGLDVSWWRIGGRWRLSTKENDDGGGGFCTRWVSIGAGCRMLCPLGMDVVFCGDGCTGFDDGPWECGSSVSRSKTGYLTRRIPCPEALKIS
jgi:hypothetical protein